jgi:1-phosphatidylinositol-4-phosphate 5-kinase
VSEQSQDLVRSAGKSGSMFFSTDDGKFFLKTILKAEFKALRTILPNYVEHMNQHELSKVLKFYGVYTVIEGGRTTYCLIFENLIPAEIEVDRKFDLKGRALKRKLPEKEVTGLIRDKELLRKFHVVDAEQRRELIDSLTSDVQFLKTVGMLDYSLFIAILRLPQFTNDQISRWCKDPNDAELRAEDGGDEGDAKKKSKKDKKKKKKKNKKSEVVEERDENGLSFEQQKQLVVDLMPKSRPFYFAVNPETKVPEVFFIGIIDCLTDWNIMKIGAHNFKIMRYRSATLSTVNPVYYAKRFENFVINRLWWKEGESTESPYAEESARMKRPYRDEGKLPKEEEEEEKPQRPVRPTKREKSGKREKKAEGEGEEKEEKHDGEKKKKVEETRPRSKTEAKEKPAKRKHRSNSDAKRSSE